MRYYSEDRAENEVEKASVRKGKNEIHKCLGYLTEFVYDTVVTKRKRAIDDIRSFCLTGIDQKKDWKEINEDLKDEIFFYFNSKFAREGYHADNGEPFSLYDDIIKDKKEDFATLFKYMRVMDEDVMGTSGSPKDNIKHLRGAVRLIRRSDVDNPILPLLHVFSLLVLKRANDVNSKIEIERDFIEGYNRFLELSPTPEDFYAGIKRFYEELNAKGRNVASEDDIENLKSLAAMAELTTNEQWLKTFNQKYNDL